MKRYGLIGKTLGHSFSKDFFEDFFRKNRIEAAYDNIEIHDISKAREVLEQGYSGLNVTIPYKESMMDLLDGISDEAREVGAVNVIRIVNGKAYGYNTDVYGFRQSIKPFLTNRHERAIILGTGGAAKAVAYVLKSIGIDVIWVSRHPQGNKQFVYEEINEHMVSACKLVVNCTPIGTWPNTAECPPFPFEFLTSEHLVIDLIYNPVKTEFLARAEKMGATILNGTSMLKEQALKAWEIWNSEDSQ